jgi:hypothetical protein
MRRIGSLALAVGLTLPLLSACSRGGVKAGTARITPHGVVQVAVGTKPYTTLRKATTVRDGARVLVRSGTAEVHLPRAEVDLRVGSEIRVGQSSEVLAGDALALGGMTVTSAGSTAIVSGAARISRQFAVTVASYTGWVDIRSAGTGATVPALRQVAIPSLGQVAGVVPLQYRSNDKWDRRFLADAIDLGIELQSRSDGASAEFQGQGTTSGFYKLLYPQLADQPDFNASLIDPARSPGEHIVGAGIALAGSKGDFATRWREVFAFRGQGAAWGLVAADQGVVHVPGLVGRIDDALGRFGLPGRPGPVALPARTGPTTPATTPTGPGQGPSGSTTTTTTTTSTTTTSTLLTEPPPTGVAPIDTTLDQTVDTLNGLLSPVP